METKKGSWDREIIASAFPREMGVCVPSFLKVFRNSDCNPSRIPRRGEATLKAIFLPLLLFIQARLPKNLWTCESSANFATILPPSLLGWPPFDKHSIEEVLHPIPSLRIQKILLGKIYILHKSNPFLLNWRTEEQNGHWNKMHLS